MLIKVGHIGLPPHFRDGGFDHAAVHLGSAQLFVAHTANDSIEVIDTERDTFLMTIEGHRGVAGALVDEESGTVFTSDRAAGTVSSFNITDPDSKTITRVGGKPNGMAFAPNHRLLLAANVGKLDGSPGVTVSFIDTDSGILREDIEVPGRTRWSVYDAKRDRFYVNIADPAQILVFNASEPARQAASIPVSATGPHGLDIDSSLDRLFCACDGAALVAFDLESRLETGRAELAGVPDVVFVSESHHRIYVAIGDPGVIQVFDTCSLELLETVTTELGAHTIGFDSARAKVYAFAPHSCRAIVFKETQE